MSYKNFAGLTRMYQDTICSHVSSKKYSKSECAARYGVSARTIGRIVEQGLFKNSKDLETKEGFKVGDIITCLKSKENSYSITKAGVPCKVTAIYTTHSDRDIEVEVLTGPHNRKVYPVESKNFEKVGDVSVKVPSTKPKTNVKKLMELPVAEAVSVESELDKLQRLNDAATFIKVGNSLMITYDGFQRTVSKDHPQFNKIVDYVLERNFKDAVALMDVTIGIKKWAKGDVTIDEGVTTYKGHVVHNNLAKRIAQLMGEGDKGFEKFANFLENLMSNPSATSIKQSYDFINHNDIEINEDGTITAFKVVTSDYMDKHTRTIDNSIGCSPSMDRGMVDDDRDALCSHGLHVCAKSYIKSFYKNGDRIVKVVLSPNGIVSIPSDYSGSKMRCTGYTVIEDVTDICIKGL